MSATEFSALVQDEDLDQDSKCTSPVKGEATLLNAVALTPSAGEYGRSRHRNFQQIENSIFLQLQFFLRKADDTLNSFIQGKKCLNTDTVFDEVQNLLYTCQPFFNHLENMTRSTVAQNNPLPAMVCTKLLDFSQQLSDKLEVMLLGFASCGLLSMNEREPRSVSQFCIGQWQFGQLRLTAFRYCLPTPYLSQVNVGLYKRMRWNVERKDEQGQTETEYYFLCYENSSMVHGEAGVVSHNQRRIWSIGQWMQVYPDPKADDINDWITCEVPLANYHMLLFLGKDEPSSCKATDTLMKLLLTLNKTD